MPEKALFTPFSSLAFQLGSNISTDAWCIRATGCGPGDFQMQEKAFFTPSYPAFQLHLQQAAALGLNISTNAWCYVYVLLTMLSRPCFSVYVYTLYSTALFFPSRTEQTYEYRRTSCCICKDFLLHIIILFFLLALPFSL